MLLFCCTLEHARICQYDGGIFIAVGHTVNHDAVKLSGFQILLLYIKVAVWDTIIEDTFRNFQFWAFLFH